MVPNNAQSHGIFPNFGAFYRASCGVVHFCAAQQAFLKGGIARLADGTIAGAATNLFEGMRNAILFGVPETDAVRAATANPAAALGVLDQVGTIAPGKKADFVVCRGDYTGRRVFLGGEEIA